MVIKIDMRAALLLAILFIPVLLLSGQDQSNDVVVVCVKDNGSMRVVDLSAACGDNEEVLSLASASHTVISGYEIITKSTQLDRDDYKYLTVECPEGKVAISGGAGIFFDDIEGYDAVPHLISNFMYPDNNGWYAEAIQPESATTSWYLEVQVICVTSGMIQ